MSVFQKLLDTIKIRGACYVILIDPDKKNDESIYDQVEKANRSDVDAIFVGGSLMMDGKSNDRAEKIKQLSNIPIVLFPGTTTTWLYYYVGIQQAHHVGK